MKPLYPAIKPYAQHQIKVDTHHTLHVEECGDKEGLPVLFVHGGPGAGTTPDDRRFFDPEHYRIILFDQRGCGHSTPHGSLENNTTQDLLSDIEAIRSYFNIKQWVLFGGSWGSTLSLLYAQKHPENVMGMILRGIFLGRQQELRWFYQGGAKAVFPDYWEEFVFPIPEEERDNLIHAYYKRLTGPDELARMNAAKHWAQWEGQCATLHPCKAVLERFTQCHTAASLAAIETHYFMNHCFIQENQILRDAYKLEGIPGIIVHGRYDMICPFENARALNQAWPESELYVIRDAGHSSAEPGITDALVNATEKMLKRHR
ncbi:prolyl aminopeptidase [Candidatus Berkiella aquae]|uniref:Proline iminopeptidase n=1 Tax=Candidatus Berkiella aquae TaxID=295108 RepID=A0A0Q9YMY5_9GAMM|nr:prolyl aminopeptidase [Candidatus Berkiella aquae]MCS5712658.1 prolyl aminopeptidase [Candidatus Berkiella aquae]